MASAGITSRRSARPTASGLSSWRGSRSWIDRPTESITSGSIASARRCRPLAIQAGGAAGISVTANTSAHSGGNFTTRRTSCLAPGGVSPE